MTEIYINNEYDRIVIKTPDSIAFEDKEYILTYSWENYIEKFYTKIGEFEE